MQVSSSPSPRPDLSVVVVVGPLRERAAGCLASLLTQDEVARLDVLLVDLRAGLPPVAGAHHSAGLAHINETTLRAPLVAD